MATIDRSNYPGIPEDFPIEAVSFALPGAQAKLSVSSRANTTTPPAPHPRKCRKTMRRWWTWRIR